MKRPKCGKYTVYTDLFDKEKKVCRNPKCGWSRPKKTEADIPRFLRKEYVFPNWCSLPEEEDVVV